MLIGERIKQERKHELKNSSYAQGTLVGEEFYKSQTLVVGLQKRNTIVKFEGLEFHIISKKKINRIQKFFLKKLLNFEVEYVGDF